MMFRGFVILVWLVGWLITEGIGNPLILPMYGHLSLESLVAALFPTEQQAYVKASNTDAFDEFGRVVAISGDGNTLAVGTHLEDSNATGIGGDDDNDDGNADSSGAVYVFTRSGSTWSQQAYIKASNAEANDLFARSLALSGDGNTLAVGANGEDSNAVGVGGNDANNSTGSSGAVYVFTRSGSTWTQEEYIKASNTGFGDQFGENIALSGDGDTLAVGAVDEQSSATGIGGLQFGGAAQSGAVYIFTRSGGTWTQEEYIKASNTAIADQFGGALALSSDGDTLAVGAHLEDSNATGINGAQGDGAGSAGAVYVFTRNVATWTQQEYIKASNTDLGDRFGDFLTLSDDGNTLAVAATFEQSNATGIGGNQADDSASSAGAVYVFTRSGTTWSQQAYVKASNTEANDEYAKGGLTLSDEGNTLAVGATNERSNATGIGGNQADNSVISAGAVYVYTRSGSTWSQKAYVKSSNTEFSDAFGHSVALSSAGNTLAVAARLEQSNATGIGGNQADNTADNAGAMYIFVAAE